MVATTRTTRSYAERWSPQAVEECCQLWDLSQEERAKLLQLKENVSDLDDHWKNDPFELVRFGKEFHFDLKTVKDKFRNSIQWRIETNADHILEDYTPPALYNYFPLAVLQGADRDGDPIYIERSGAADTLGLLERFGKDEMIQQAIWGKELMTRGPWHDQWQHGRVKNFTSILDLKGLNRHHLNPALVPVGQAVTRLVQDNYPGIGKKILVIRAPFFFRFVWNIFKHFVDPHVKELIEIATEKETPQLLERYMDLSVLPKEIVPEGRGRAIEGYEVVWEGGSLPPPTKDDWKRRTPIYPSAAAEDKLIEGYEVVWDGEDKPATPTTTNSTNSNSNSTVTTPRTPLQQQPENSYKTPQHYNTQSSWESLPKILETPLQATNSGTTMDTGMSDWESLPPATTPRRNIPQAWTVTPRQQYDLDQIWSPSNMKGVAQLWQLNDNDKKNMLLLRDNFRDIHHWKNDPYEVIRFYKQFDGSVHATEQHFRKMIVWRVENHMDDFLEKHGQPDPRFHHMPICILKGHDKDGDPIYIDRMGACDYYPLLRHFGAERMVNHITFLRELNSTPQFWQQSYEAQVGHKVRSYTVIIDLEGLNAGHMRPALLSLLKRTTKLSQENYAGWAKRILVIRAPPIFKRIWGIVKRFFAPHIRALIEISQGDPMALLDQYMNREVLPSVICSDGGDGPVMPGYYENVQLKGGPIPKEAFQNAKSGNCADTLELVPIFSPSQRAPMPPDSELDGSDGLSTPVTTTCLCLGDWDGDLEEEESQGKKAVRNEASIRAYASPPPKTKEPWQSPMFKYNW